MRRIYLDFDKPADDLQDAFQRVDEAFETESTIPVSGTQEGVAVAFDLKVQYLAKRQFGARKILEFSGVTVPEGGAYIAYYKHELESNRIDLKLYSSDE